MQKDLEEVLNQWHQLDVNNAFLNDTLSEEIFMNIPQGYKHSITKGPNEPSVCKLNRSIYGFKQSKYDYSLFTKGEGDNFIAILVYVDDIILASPSQEIIFKAKTILKKHFKLKDLGDLKIFLGLELSRSKEGIFMCHGHYTLSILEDCGMLACKPSLIPMETNNKLTANSGTKLVDPGSCRRLIGRLLYLTISKPDI